MMVRLDRLVLVEVVLGLDKSVDKKRFCAKPNFVFLDTGKWMYQLVPVRWYWTLDRFLAEAQAHL